MSTFTADTTKNHAIIPTIHINDKMLSLKAKGLMTQLLAYPKTWDGTLSGLIELNNDTEYSVKKALTELENQGYIYKSRYRKDNGQFDKANYTLLIYPANLADNPIHHQTQQPKYQK